MTDSPNNFSGGGSTMPSGATPAPQDTAAPSVPTQEMPAQAAAAQFTPSRALPTEHVHEQKAKKGKGKGVLASIVSIVAAVAVGFLVRYAFQGGFTSTPTTDDVQKGIEKIYDEEINTSSFVKQVASELGGDEEDVKAFLDKSGSDFAQCMTNKVYGSVEKETKSDLAKAKNEFLEKDVDTIEKALTECSEKLGEGYTASLPEPTKEEFKSGAEKIFNSSFNVPETEKEFIDAGHDKEKVKDFLSHGGSDFGQCMTDELYDSVSSLTKKQISQGRDKQSSADLLRVAEAGKKCMAEAGKKHGIG